MLPVEFCNYNVDYQQRLGFLKLLVWAGESSRGGKEELLHRIESLYSPSATRPKRAQRHAAAGRHAERPHAVPHVRGKFDPDVLLQLEDVPSWQAGFSFQRLDRLVLWGEMVGLITPSGRLAEWAKPLVVDQPLRFVREGVGQNPFLLSRRERAFFLALLVYHDHVLLHLISLLSRLNTGARVDTRKACIEVVDGLGKTLDSASGTNIQAVRARQSLRDVLERVAFAEKLPHRAALVNPEERLGALREMHARATRNHLIEYHAACRFEQLTDLRLLVKEDPANPPKTPGDRYRARTSWVWYTTEWLKSLGDMLQAAGCNDVEVFLQGCWARACSLEKGGDLRQLDAVEDQQEIAHLMDTALPRAMRQFGAIQVHSWVFITALDAIERGTALEFSTAYSLLDAIRRNPNCSGYIRQSGQQTYLGRTASVLGGSMFDIVSRYPITR